MNQKVKKNRYYYIFMFVTYFINKVNILKMFSISDKNNDIKRKKIIKLENKINLLNKNINVNFKILFSFFLKTKHLKLQYTFLKMYFL